jgi:enolase
MMSDIHSLQARQLLGAALRPVVEVEVRLYDGKVGRAAVSADPPTLQAASDVNDVVAPYLQGEFCGDQIMIDERVLDLNGSDARGRLTPQLRFAISGAIARAVAASEDITLQAVLAAGLPTDLPAPRFALRREGFTMMVLPLRSHPFRSVARIEPMLRSLVSMAGDDATPETLLQHATQQLVGMGLTAGSDFGLAIRLDPTRPFRDAETAAVAVQRWLDGSPLLAVEDLLPDAAWGAWRTLTTRFGERLQIVKGRVAAPPIVTKKRLKHVVHPLPDIQRLTEERAGNAVRIVPTLLGSMTEILSTVVSLRELGCRGACQRI